MKRLEEPYVHTAKWKKPIWIAYDSNYGLLEKAKLSKQ